MNAPDYVAELALIEASRIQREAMALDMDAIENWDEGEGDTQD